MTERVSDPGSRVLIVEQNPTGHRLFYVRLLADAARASGSVVTIVLSLEEDRDSEAVHLGGLSAGVDVRRREPLSLTAVEQLSRSLEATRTIIPDGDRFALRLATRRGWRGAGRVSVLIMREAAQPGSSRLVTATKSLVRTLAFRRAATMPRVDVRVLKSAGWTGRSRIPAAIDPVQVTAGDEDVVTFRARYGIEDDRYWFAVLGAVSARKNLDLVMQALAGVAAPVGLVVAGQLDSDISQGTRDQLVAMERSGTAIVIDRLLTDSELDAAVAASDCVVLAHSNEGPSGLLGKAAAVGTRVVAAGATSLRRDLEQLPGLGEWTGLSVAALTSAFDRASGQRRPSPVLSTTSSRFTEALL